MAGYIRQASASIATGLVIRAGDINSEFDALRDAFSGSTGHAHDGSTGNAPQIDLTTSVTGLLPVANGGTGASTAANARTNLGLVIGTDVQAYDAGLASIAGLTTAADTMIYTTALDTYATTSLTAFGRSLIDDANAGTARTTLGLVIGTDVQAYDATLTSIAALGTAADKYLYSTGVDTWAEGSITSFGRSILDDADASAVRTTLGLVIGTNVQAYDATLASLSSLGTAADKLAYTTGVDTWAETAITSFARTLLDDTTQGDARTTLGVGTGDSPTFVGITISGTPSANSTDAARMIDVFNATAGLDVKASVRLLADSNVTLSGEQTIDGQLTSTDRVLLTGQTTASENGIYVTAAGAWSRATDADSDAEVNAGLFCWVEEGATYGDSGWILVTDDPITLDTTSLSFTQFSGAGAITAGAGLTKSGNTLDVVGTADRITVNANDIDIASTYVGQTSITTLGTISTGTWQGTAVAVAYGGTGAASASAARTNLGLVIGTDVQAYNATLASIAALGTAADKYAYTTGVDTWAEGSITTFGRSLIDDADASAARTTLGLVIGTDVVAQSHVGSSGSSVHAIATTSTAGFVELSTDAENDTGTSTSLVASVNGIDKLRSKYRDVPSASTSTSYTFVLDDRGKYLRFNGASDGTWTIPPNSSVAFDIGTRIDIEVIHATSKLTIADGAGVTTNARGGNHSMDVQFGVISLVKVDTDTWTVIGGTVT